MHLHTEIEKKLKLHVICLGFTEHTPGVREGVVEIVGFGCSEAPLSVVEGLPLLLLLLLLPVAHHREGKA